MTNRGAVTEQDVPTITVVDTVGAGDTYWGNCLGDWVTGFCSLRVQRHAWPPLCSKPCWQRLLIAQGPAASRRLLQRCRQILPCKCTPLLTCK